MPQRRRRFHTHFNLLPRALRSLPRISFRPFQGRNVYHQESGRYERLSDVLDYYRHHRRPSTRSNNPSNITADASGHSMHGTRPPLARSRRAIVATVSSVTLPPPQCRNLYKSGWTCCICLDDPVTSIPMADDCTSTSTTATSLVEGHEIPYHTSLPILQPIALLGCQHAMHAHCLETWLEKGRPVCCLCNGPIYPAPTSSKDDDDDSSGAISFSALDVAANADSPTVERVEPPVLFIPSTAISESHT